MRGLLTTITHDRTTRVKEAEIRELARAFESLRGQGKREDMTLVLGVPKCVRSDNGPEFIARAIQRWLDHVDVRTLYIEPGSPGENSCAESFHSRLRDQFLALEVFERFDRLPITETLTPRMNIQRWVQSHCGRFSETTALVRGGSSVAQPNG